MNLTTMSAKDVAYYARKKKDIGDKRMGQPSPIMSFPLDPNTNYSLLC